MSAGRKKLLLILLGVAVVLWVIGAALIPVIESVDAKTKADNVILNGVPFILIFIGIIVAFIDFIILMATRLNNKISEKTYSPIEKVLIGGIVLGVVGMFQPFTVVLYTLGFIVLLISTLSYIAWSHVVPRIELDRTSSAPIGEIEQHNLQG